MNDRKLPLHVRIIQAELLRRQAKNPRYSMRAFSLFLDIHPSALSRVLNGKMDLSLETCASLIEKLNLPLDEVRLFIASVAEDKRNRSAALLTRAIDPKLLDKVDFETRQESIVKPQHLTHLTANDVLALGSDILSMMDLSGRFIFADETASQVLRTLPCQLIGLKWSGTSLEQQTAMLLEAQEQQVVADGKEKSFEFTMNEGASQRFFVRTVTPVFGGDKTMHAFISAIKDVTWERISRIATQAIHSSVDLNVVLNTIPRATTQALASAAVLELNEVDGKRRVVSAHHVNEEQSGEFFDFVVSEGLNSQNMEAQASILHFKNSPPPSAVLINPLKNSGKDVGTLILFHQKGFDHERTEIAKYLATNAAQAIVNARFYS